MATVQSVVNAIRSAVSQAGSAKVAAEKAAYFKHVAQFYGVKTPTLETLVEQHVVSPIKTAGWQPQLIRDMVSMCVQDKYQEMKQAGVLSAWRLKTLLLKDGGAAALVDTTEALFDTGHVYDWAICDTLCGRVLFECLKVEPALAQRIAAWKDSPLLWKQRAAAVTFVKLAKPQYGYHDTVLDICGTIVKSPERFVQLGCGWVLREVSVHDLHGVVAFIKSNYSAFSREGLRYAIEKMDGPLRSELLAFKPLSSTDGSSSSAAAAAAAPAAGSATSASAASGYKSTGKRKR